MSFFKIIIKFSIDFLIFHRNQFLKLFRDSSLQFDTRMSVSIYQMVENGDLKGVEKALELDAKKVSEKDSVSKIYELFFLI